MQPHRSRGENAPESQPVGSVSTLSSASTPSPPLGDADAIVAPGKPLPFLPVRSAVAGYMFPVPSLSMLLLSSRLYPLCLLLLTSHVRTSTPYPHPLYRAFQKLSMRESKRRLAPLHL